MSDVDRWLRILEPIVAGRLHVLDEVDSTQDAARALGCDPGDVVTTLRQRAGRGRYGRAWADTGLEGVAITLVEATGAPLHLALATAVGAATAVERHLGGPVGVKWPNDLVVAGRKLAGVLVEQDARTAAIGIGVNVHQERWPAELAGRAVSLRQLGAEVDRPSVAASLVEAVREALGRDEAWLAGRFDCRDALRGAEAVIRSGDRRVRGRVVRVDPARGLLIDVEGRRERIPLATATIESWSPDRLS